MVTTPLPSRRRATGFASSAKASRGKARAMREPRITGQPSGSQRLATLRRSVMRFTLLRSVANPQPDTWRTSRQLDRLDLHRAALVLDQDERVVLVEGVEPLYTGQALDRLVL